MTTLGGVRVLVTGAAAGIGRAIATELAVRGASVAGIDIRPAERAGVAMRVADVADEAATTAAVAWAVETLGGLDVLVNNAGIVLEKPLLDTTAAEFDRVIAVNLRGTFVAGREAARHFLAAPRAEPGRIINLASELAHLGRAEYSPYCASKGGVIALTRSWARELAPRVLVNAVAPGPDRHRDAAGRTPVRDAEGDRRRHCARPSRRAAGYCPCRRLPRRSRRSVHDRLGG